MDRILGISRILSECKIAFAEGETGLTLNEALTLEVIKNKSGRSGEIAHILFKDRAYISRLTKSLVTRGKIYKRASGYILTEDGERDYRESQRIMEEIIKNIGIEG